MDLKHSETLLVLEIAEKDPRTFEGFDCIRAAV